MASKTNSISNDYSSLLHLLKASKRNKTSHPKKKPEGHSVISKSDKSRLSSSSSLIDDEIGDVDISDIEMGLQILHMF